MEEKLECFQEKLKLSKDNYEKKLELLESHYSVLKEKYTALIEKHSVLGDEHRLLEETILLEDKPLLKETVLEKPVCETLIVKEEIHQDNRIDKLLSTLLDEDVSNEDVSNEDVSYDENVLEDVSALLQKLRKNPSLETLEKIVSSTSSEVKEKVKWRTNYNIHHLCLDRELNFKVERCYRIPGGFCISSASQNRIGGNAFLSGKR